VSKGHSVTHDGPRAFSGFEQARHDVMLQDVQPGSKVLQAKNLLIFIHKKNKYKCKDHHDYKYLKGILLCILIRGQAMGLNNFDMMLCCKMCKNHPKFYMLKFL